MATFGQFRRSIGKQSVQGFRLFGDFAFARFCLGCLIGERSVLIGATKATVSFRGDPDGEPDVSTSERY
ncbi:MULTISPECIES: hypothetical protein [Comamonadaceae]|uniref:hypothetical protein n=1 Tax=Comamonadaceae TaxID=80864 RepID=UPI0006A59254|nr:MULTISPECIES: hypothetical protein [Comamonadaceae]QHE89423.1 hypothetical protein F9K07_31045 [Hydrogenophaga sp. BPS33]